MKHEKAIEQFTSTNDVRKTVTTLVAMLARDIKANPDLYEHADIDTDIVELIGFLVKLEPSETCNSDTVKISFYDLKQNQDQEP